jgi:hypothetical protein
MTPNELLKREPESTSYEVGRLNGFYYHHIPELEFNILPTDDPNRRVELKFYKDFNFDYRRIWALASVWFDGKPFMIVQNAGKEGDNHYKRFVTDEATYKEALKYLSSIVLFADKPVEDVVDADADIPNLTSFYSHTLDGYFERSRY